MTMTETKPLHLHLHRLEIHDFLRLEALTVDAQGRHVILTGANGTGKTSAVEAIWAALGGAASVDLPEPVRRGAERASAALDLGEYQVVRSWTPDGTRLTVTAANGAHVNRPQQLLDGLLGRYTLDPVAFLSRRPLEQVNDLLRALDVAPPVAAAREVLGESAPAAAQGESAAAYLDRLIAPERGEIYLRRRLAARDRERLQAALVESRRGLEDLGGRIREDEAVNSPADLVSQIEELSRRADQRHALVNDAQGAANARERGLDLLSGLRDERDDLVRRIGELQQQLGEIEKRIVKGNKICAQLAEEAETAAKAVKALADHAPRLADLRRQLAQGEAASQQLTQRRLAQERVEQLTQETAAAQAAHVQLDQALEDLRALRGRLLEDAELGIPGLELGDGELRLNGVSLRQASMAERIRVACAVAMKESPRLRLLRIDEGERLDTASRELLLQLASEHGYQVILTAVANVDRLKVEIIEQAPQEVDS